MHQSYSFPLSPARRLFSFQAALSVWASIIGFQIISWTYSIKKAFAWLKRKTIKTADPIASPALLTGLQNQQIDSVCQRLAQLRKSSKGNRPTTLNSSTWKGLKLLEKEHVTIRRNLSSIPLSPILVTASGELMEYCIPSGSRFRKDVIDIEQLQDSSPRRIYHMITLDSNLLTVIEP